MPKVLFPNAVRRGIASNDPVAQAMWARGETLSVISRYLGYRSKTNSSAVGVLDPGVYDPAPPRVPTKEWRAGESDEARVWRRFPITSHKMGR